MPDYKSMYFQLYNQVTEAINILQNAQIMAEEAYISESKPSIIPLTREDKKDPQNK